MRFLKYFNEQQKEELVEKINGLNIDNDIKDKWFDIIKERIESSFFQQYQLETETHQAVMSKSIIILLQMIMILNICIRLILEINNY